MERPIEGHLEDYSASPKWQGYETQTYQGLEETERTQSKIA